MPKRSSKPPRPETGTAFKTIKTGQPVNASVCLDKNGNAALEPGTSATF